jgi:hypothetical protein
MLARWRIQFFPLNRAEGHASATIRTRTRTSSPRCGLDGLLATHSGSGADSPNTTSSLLESAEAVSMAVRGLALVSSRRLDEDRNFHLWISAPLEDRQTFEIIIRCLLPKLCHGLRQCQSHEGRERRNGMQIRGPFFRVEGSSRRPLSQLSSVIQSKL